MARKKPPKKVKNKAIYTHKEVSIEYEGSNLQKSICRIKESSSGKKQHVIDRYVSMIEDAISTYERVGCNNSVWYFKNALDDIKC